MIISSLADSVSILDRTKEFIYFRDDKSLSLWNMMFAGKKTMETRPRNVFKSVDGHRVGVILLCGSKRLFVGDCVIRKAREWKTGKEFDKDYKLHRIGKKSPWRKKTGVGYAIEDSRWCVPIPYKKPENAVGNRSYFRLEDCI